MNEERAKLRIYLGGGVLVQSLGELVDGRWHLQAVLEHTVLALKTHVLRPSHEARKITLGLNVVACIEISQSGNNERERCEPMP